MTERHHTSTTKWQDSWIRLPEQWFNRVESTSRSPLCLYLKPRTFPMGVYRMWSLPSGKACDPKPLEGCNASSD